MEIHYPAQKTNNTSLSLDFRAADSRAAIDLPSSSPAPKSRTSIFAPRNFARLVLCALFALMLEACGAESKLATEEAEKGAAQDVVSPSETDAGEGDDSIQVTYEPAYPEEVSGEGLDSEDASQQEAHSHGGEEHSHGGSSEEEHEH